MLDPVIVVIAAGESLSAPVIAAAGFPGGVDIVSDGVLHDKVVHVGGSLEVCFFPLVPVIGWA